MFRTRPPLFAIVCICMWLMQLVLLAVAFYGYDEERPSDRRWWELAALVISVGLVALLLVQLPRALQWRPRLRARASPEVMAERRRIAQDLHDNLGAKLVFAMALLDTEPPAVRELRSLLDKCMLDLRLVVDSMDAQDEPFADRLARDGTASSLCLIGVASAWCGMCKFRRCPVFRTPTVPCTWLPLFRRP